MGAIYMGICYIQEEQGRAGQARVRKGWPHRLLHCDIEPIVRSFVSCVCMHAIVVNHQGISAPSSIRPFNQPRKLP
jgi:hypothetical protein